MTVAIVTDSGSDLTPAQLADNAIVQVPLTVSFGEESFLSPDELSPEAFWERVRQPDCVFPRTAAPSAGAFRAAFEAAFTRGAEAVVYVGLSETLSATVRNGQMAAAMLEGRDIRVVDSRSAWMGVGALALRGAELARDGAGAADIARELEEMRPRLTFYVALETLDYLRRGGRISGARAAIGTLLSVKPIMTIEEGLILPADQPRTRARARERLLQLMTAQRLVGLHIAYSPPADPEPLLAEALARLPGPPPLQVTTQLIGPVIGTHIGPGALGGILVLAG